MVKVSLVPKNINYFLPVVVQGASSAHEALLVTKRLMGGECVDKRLEYTFKDIYWPQKLKGTLTYIAAVSSQLKLLKS